MSVTSQRPVSGVLWMLGTGINFVMVNVLVKYVGTTLPSIEAAFLRFLLGLVFLIPMIPAIREVTFTPLILKLALARGVVHAAAMASWFFAMTRIPMSEVTAMNFMNPVYVTLGAVIFLGEKIALPRVLALCAAFIGGLVILRPGFREIDPGHIAMMFTAMAFAVGYLLAKRLTALVPAAAVVFLLSIVVPVAVAPFAFAVWETPGIRELVLLFFTAAFATAAHYCMTRAFEAAPMAVIQPVTFLQLIWAVLLGMVLFGEAFDPWVILGGGIIMASVSFITWREARQKRTRKAPETL